METSHQPNVRVPRPLRQISINLTPHTNDLPRLAETVDGLYKAELIHAQGPWTSVGVVELVTVWWVH